MEFTQQEKEIRARNTADAVKYVHENTGLSEEALHAMALAIDNAMKEQDLIPLTTLMPELSGESFEEGKSIVVAKRWAVLKDIKAGAELKTLYRTSTVAGAVNTIKTIPSHIESVNELPADYEAPTGAPGGNEVYADISSGPEWEAARAQFEMNKAVQ